MTAAALEAWRMNAFTDRPFAGNPAGVVPAADGLDDALMQCIARELNSVSETAFVLVPETADADFRLRFFTSTVEVDLCGHATIAALFALAASGRLSGSDGTRTVRAETRVGTLELGLEFEHGQLRRASMTQLAPAFDRPSHPERIAGALGLPAYAIDPDIPIGCASTGIWSCYVPLVSREALGAVRVVPRELAGIWPDQPAFAGVYPYTITGADADRTALTAQGRFFSLPQYGIPEDPVTGTASGALGGWLIEQGVMSGDGTLTVTQGVEMGRPGRVDVVRAPSGAMRISGAAVAVFRGEVLAAGRG